MTVRLLHHLASRLFMNNNCGTVFQPLLKSATKHYKLIMAPFNSMRTVLWVFATLALVSTISDTNNNTGEKSWGIVKEGVRALSYIPGLLPNHMIGSANDTTENGDSQASVARELRTIMEKNRALKAASDNDSASGAKKDDTKDTTTTVGAGGDTTDAKDMTTAPDDDIGPGLLDHLEDANKTSIIPPESEEQPREWPATVLVIFLVLAAVLLIVTGVRNCRKKSQYTEVPATSLIV